MSILLVRQFSRLGKGAELGRQSAWLSCRRGHKFSLVNLAIQEAHGRMSDLGSARCDTSRRGSDATTKEGEPQCAA